MGFEICMEHTPLWKFCKATGERVPGKTKNQPQPPWLCSLRTKIKRNPSRRKGGSVIMRKSSWNKYRWKNTGGERGWNSLRLPAFTGSTRMIGRLRGSWGGWRRKAEVEQMTYFLSDSLHRSNYKNKNLSHCCMVHSPEAIENFLVLFL